MDRLAPGTNANPMDCFFPSLRLLTAATLACCVVPLFSTLAEDEKLVPARMSEMHDKLGNVWGLDSSGSVQQSGNDNGNACFQRAATMTVGRGSMNFESPMMTADGAEYVFRGRTPSSRVTRRVRLDAERGAMRYLEIFENTTKIPAPVQVVISTMMATPAARYMNLHDKPMGGAFGNEDGAYAVSEEEGHNDAVFITGYPKGKTNPRVTVQDNRKFDVTYSLTLPPEGSVAIVHYVAQCAQGSAKQAKDLLAVYFKNGRLVDPGIPAAYKSAISNFSVGKPAEAEDEPLELLEALTQLSTDAKLSRENVDGLVIDAGSKLAGTITGSDFEIETAYGKTKVAFANVAGVSGGEGMLSPVRVFLRDGEILNGTVNGAKVSMATDGGLSFDVDFAQMQLLTMRAGKADSVPPPKAAMLVMTQLGDRLALSADAPAPIEAATPWGMARVPLADVRSIAPVREPFPAQRFELTDGSHFLAMLRGGEWTAPTLRFGPVKMMPQGIRAMSRVAAGPRVPEGPRCELIGENQLAGSIDLAALSLATDSAVTQIDPKQILAIESDEAGGSSRTVTVKLTGGQALKGRLVDNVVPIRNGDRTWRVPASHFSAFHRPEPEPPEEKPAEPAKEDAK